ncbi:hypothetical protein A2U01_0073193, partial [Trifolium medium]|nr:hypothetical protein [Trifolium medium]
MCAAHSCAEWDNVNTMQQRIPTTAMRPEPMQWQRPDYGMLKCNVDVSFFTSRCSSGWG